MVWDWAGEPPAEVGTTQGLAASLTLRSERAPELGLGRERDSLGHRRCCCCGHHAFWGEDHLQSFWFWFLCIRCTGISCFPTLPSLWLAGLCPHLFMVPALPLNSVPFTSPRQTFFCCYNYYCYLLLLANKKRTHTPILITENADRQKEQEKHHNSTQRDPWAASSIELPQPFFFICCIMWMNYNLCNSIPWLMGINVNFFLLYKILSDNFFYIIFWSTLANM